MGARSPKSSQFDEARRESKEQGLSVPWIRVLAYPIDKLDLRLPRLTQLRPDVADFIKASRGFSDSTRRLGSKYYEFVTDLRPMGIDACLHLGLKHRGDHAGEGKLEIKDVGKKTLSEITEEISKIIESPITELEIMRIDLCADVRDVPIEWFFERLRVKYKRVGREIGLTTDRIGKVGIQTTYAGTRPNLLRVYNKVAEYQDQLSKELRKAKKYGTVEDLNKLTLEGRFGVSKHDVITRIERQFGGGCLPRIVPASGKAITIRTFGQLARLPDANPFSNVQIVNGSGSAIPTIEECGFDTWLTGTKLMELRDEMGEQQFHRWLNAKSSGNGARYKKHYAAFLERGDNLITVETIYQIYRKSVMEQLAS